MRGEAANKQEPSRQVHIVVTMWIFICLHSSNYTNMMSAKGPPSSLRCSHCRPDLYDMAIIFHYRELDPFCIT